jgi:hypothetical protein
MINRMLLYDFFYKSELIEMSLVNYRVQHIRLWIEGENNIYKLSPCWMLLQII